jgi:hypothetical protein
MTEGHRKPTSSVIALVVSLYAGPLLAGKNITMCRDAQGRPTFSDVGCSEGTTKQGTFYAPDAQTYSRRWSQGDIDMLQRYDRANSGVRSMEQAPDRQREHAALTEEQQTQLKNLSIEEADLRDTLRRPVSHLRREWTIEELKEVKRKRAGILGPSQNPSALSAGMPGPKRRPVEPHTAPSVAPRETPPVVDSKYPYRGFSGAGYQYDLTKPMDRLRYQTDFAAQNRDRIDVRRKSDQFQGQQGGGIKWGD